MAGENDGNGILYRTLAPIDISAIQHWVKDKIAHEPDPHTWRQSEQMVMQLVAEVVRYRRKVGEEPLTQSDIVGEYTGDECKYCGSMKMMRTGSCCTCMNCGESGGCA